MMNKINKLSIFSIILVILISFTNCKTQNVNDEIPFTISEKTYLYWVSGKKGSSGTKIRFQGTKKTTNVEFPTIFFQNHEYKVSTEINSRGFVLIGNSSEQIKKDIYMHQDASREYGNEAPNTKKNIPFELQKNEAILVYSVNGKNFYHKITGIKQLETINYP